MLDSASRYQVFVGMSDVTTRTVIQCVKLIGSVHRPRPDFTLENINEFHVDAGSQLVSREFRDWANSLPHPIHIEAAAPNHQEQNGKVEAGWRHCRQIAFKILTTASLGHEFFDVALQYAWQIKAVLPLRSLFVTLPDGTTRPSTPFEIYFKQTARIGRYHVFGCPCVVKVYRRRQIDGTAAAQSLTSSNLIQRGVRGLFVGFPIDQAGYLCWIPSVGRFLISQDVAFDEFMQSPLAFPNRIYHDARPTRDAASTRGDTSIPLSYTGPPYVAIDDADPLLPWAPYTAIPPSQPVEEEQLPDVFFDAYPTEEENASNESTSAPPNGESEGSTQEEYNTQEEHAVEEATNEEEPPPVQEEAIESDAESSLFGTDTEDDNDRNDDDTYSFTPSLTESNKENEPPQNFNIPQDFNINYYAEDKAFDTIDDEVSVYFDDPREVSPVPEIQSEIATVEGRQHDSPPPSQYIRRSSRNRQSTQTDDFQYANNANTERENTDSEDDDFPYIDDEERDLHLALRDAFRVSYALRAVVNFIPNPVDTLPLARDFARSLSRSRIVCRKSQKCRYVIENRG